MNRTWKKWSKADNKRCIEIVKSASNTKEGYKIASNLLGRTLYSIQCQYSRLTAPKVMSTKLVAHPLNENKRIYNKKIALIEDKTLALDIKDINFDFKSKKIIIKY